MSNEMSMDCPRCGEEFELSEALAGPVLEAERKKARLEALKSLDAERAAIAERARMDAASEHAAELRTRDAVIADRDAKVRAAQAAELAARKAKDDAEKAAQRIELDVKRQVDAIRTSVAAEAASRAIQESSAKLAAAEASIAEKDAKLRTAQVAELAARKAKEEAEQAKRETELSVQRRVDIIRAEVAAEAARVATEEANVKLAAAQASIAAKDAKLKSAQQAELAARKAKEEAEQGKREAELAVQRRVDHMRLSIAAEATQKASDEAATKLKAAEASIAEKDAKLVAAQASELEARRLKVEAEEAKREVELTVARRLDVERSKAREQAARERDDEFRLKLGDKDEQLRAMREQIEELRRKGDQGSQQLVGEVLELDLLSTLQDAFPGDRFERVKKGLRGADVLQTVLSPSGSECGKIIWESKRTRNWSEPWLAKLRDDQRETKADVAALASETLPEGLSAFGLRDGVWVTALSSVVSMAAVLRHGLIDVSTARRAGALAESKKDHVYAYLTSPQFRQRIAGVAEVYVEMRSELDREKRATLTQLSKREKQLDRILAGVTGFYGDLQGIAGSSLPPVEGLSLAAPEDTPEKPRLSIVGTDVTSGAEEDPL
jgi:hypothetical protein